jgi:hypothetical protein
LIADANSLAGDATPHAKSSHRSSLAPSFATLTPKINALASDVNAFMAANRHLGAAGHGQRDRVQRSPADRLLPGDLR